MENTVRRIDSDQRVIPRSLTTFYHVDALMAQQVVSRGDGNVSVEFRFPEYLRSKQDMGHVSSVQITAAILEGGYCALEDALDSALFPAAVTSEWFYSTLADWLALRLNILFRKSLKAGEPANMDFRVIDIGTQRLRRRKLSATIEFKGFCSGETMWVIDPPKGLTL